MYLLAAGPKNYDWEDEDRNIYDPLLKVKRELVRVVRRGVRVSILMEASDDSSVGYENERPAGELRRAGPKVVFGSRRKATRTKLVVIDARYLFVGSHNLIRIALSRNNEFSLMVDSPELAHTALYYINRSKKNSRNAPS